jgi:hypothetical protein
LLPSGLARTTGRCHKRFALGAKGLPLCADRLLPGLSDGFYPDRVLATLNGPSVPGTTRCCRRFVHPNAARSACCAAPSDQNPPSGCFQRWAARSWSALPWRRASRRPDRRFALAGRHRGLRPRLRRRGQDCCTSLSPGPCCWSAAQSSSVCSAPDDLRDDAGDTSSVLPDHLSRHNAAQRHPLTDAVSWRPLERPLLGHDRRGSHV